MIAQFVAAMVIRTPHVRTLVYGWADQFWKLLSSAVAARYDTLTEEMRSKIGLSQAELEALSDESAPPFQLDKNQYLKTIIDILPRLTARIATMDWTIVTVPKSEYLITCDGPVTVINPRSERPWELVGFMTKDVEVTLPLNAAAFLLLGWGGSVGRMQTANWKVARQMNVRSALNADVAIYSPRRANWLQRFFVARRQGERVNAVLRAYVDKR